MFGRILLLNVLEFLPEICKSPYYSLGYVHELEIPTFDDWDDLIRSFTVAGEKCFDFDSTLQFSPKEVAFVQE
jgi:hypothetical protein